MIQGWRKYQTTLPKPRRHLSVIRSCDLESVQQPDPTVGWKRLRGWAWWLLLGAAVAALGYGAARAGGVL